LVHTDAESVALDNFSLLGRKRFGGKAGVVFLCLSMTAEEIFESVTNGGRSDFAEVVSILAKADPGWCLIGGLAVNCYVSPVYTVDADFVVVSTMIEVVVAKLAAKGFDIRRFEFSVNAQRPGSDLVIQFTTDHQAFIQRAEPREVLGHRIPVAALPDIIQGKTWVWEDPRRRLSKRTKDQADLVRIGEQYPDLRTLLPPSLRKQLARKSPERFGP
jgi:hypothetical protein